MQTITAAAAMQGDALSRQLLSCDAPSGSLPSLEAVASGSVMGAGSSSSGEGSDDVSTTL